jgi:hypothetical protein
MNFRSSKMFAYATAALAAGAVSTTSFAASTAIGSPAAGELSHAQILDGIYGGGFSASGNDFSNGAITASRVDDAADQTFNFESFSASAKAVFAGFSQSFGIVQDGTFTNLFDVSGKKTGVSGSVADVNPGGDFLFARGGDGALVTSDPTLNPGDFDGMITYEISGLEDIEGSVLLLFFEDILNAGSDFDYNDMVVEVVGSGSSQDNQPLPIPTPAAGGAGLLLLGALAFRRRLI